MKKAPDWLIWVGIAVLFAVFRPGAALRQQLTQPTPQQSPVQQVK